MPEGETRNAFAINFRAYLNLEVDTVNNVVEAIEVINQDQEQYQLLVTYTEIGKEPSLKVLVEFFKDKSLTTPILSLSEDKYVTMSTVNQVTDLK